jgi:protein-S-isoprenylcysteine O-methyltransferase Ste14
MENEFAFRSAFAAALVGSLAVRAYYYRMSGTSAAAIGDREPYEEGVRRLIWGWVLMASFLVFIFFPQWLNWSSVALPEWLRWTGLGIAVSGLVMLTWVQHALGRNFSASLRLRNDHTLVVNGPYRTMRHPMYTALILLWGGLAVLSANWFIALQVLTGVNGIIRNRAPLEEAMMLESFGDTYREYMGRTGRFLPRLWHRRVAVS